MLCIRVNDSPKKAIGSSMNCSTALVDCCVAMTGTLRGIAYDCKSVVICKSGGEQRVNTMSVMPEPLILPIRGRAPQLHAESWVAPNASIIGQVTLAARSSVWYGATLRAEAEPIEIGFGTNIQDGVTIHVDSEFPGRVGAGVSVGHNAVLHGCEVEDDALIGMGAVILNGARIGK